MAKMPFDSATRLPQVVVLDTNVVLDCLLFEDANCGGLVEQLVRGRLRWQATAAMRAELCSVLPRAELQAWNPDGEHVLSAFDQLACLLPPLPTSPPKAGLRCRDPDDQKFVDLAMAAGARWLLSRDRALLDLAKEARKHGVEILTPASWLRQHALTVSQVDSAGSA